MLHLPDVELRDTRFYKEVFVEGKADGKGRLVWRLLQRRLGPLPSFYEDRIQDLGIEGIEALLDLQDREDLDAWLGRWKRKPGPEPAGP